MQLEEKYSENARKIYERLYLARDKNGNIVESIEDCHRRVASFLAEDDWEEQEFKRLLDEQKFRPNTPCMANAGVKKNPMLLACFVLGLEDSMDSIIEMWGTAAKIYEGGGGAGIPITNLRRKGSPLTSGGEASGPMSYLDVIETISNTVKSGGKNRRAANLVAARYDHPDIKEIVDAKRGKDKYKSMNLSVSVDNRFMSNESSMFERLDPNEGSMGREDCDNLWKQICQAAWECGDPGLLFLDRVNQDNPLIDVLGEIEATNPCGEVPLWPWNACCLGHMNVYAYSHPHGFNYSAYQNDIHIAVLFLNRILEKSSYPNQNFYRYMKKYRPIGLGIMGFADLMYAENTRYGSDNSLKSLDTLTKTLTKTAYEASSGWVELGKLPRLELLSEAGSKFEQMVSRFIGYAIPNILPANITVTCIAPTGSTSISADCSFSFEPHFALTWEKQLDGGGTMTFLNKEFEKKLDTVLNSGKFARNKDDVINEIKRNKGTLKNTHFPQEYQRIRSVFVTAHDIPNEERLRMQSVAQENITMAVSSTVNLSNSATVEDVSYIFKRAWELGLKGITIYRDGCLDNQPVDFGGEKESNNIDEVEENKNPFGKGYKRPQERPGKLVEVNTPSGKLYVRGSFDQGHLMECFIDIGSQGKQINTLCDGLGRVISRALQQGVDLEDITDTLRGAGDDVFWMKLNNDEKSKQMKGLLDAVATILDEKFQSGPCGQSLEEQHPLTEIDLDKLKNDIHRTGNAADIWYSKHHDTQEQAQDRCPECGKFTLRRDVGCRDGICTSCGHSACD